MSDSKIKSATISDVARIAGVSMKTVSRVFNNEKYVSKEKKEKILKVAADLNYRPSVQARGLAGKKSHMFAIFVDKLEGDYLTKVLRGLLDRTEPAGCHLMVEVLKSRGDTEKLKQVLHSVNFDGVVLTPPICDDTVILETLKESNVPTVRISPGIDFEGSYKVAIDEFEAAQKITEYVISKGHRRIGFIKGDPRHACSLERERGYVRALQLNGLPIENSLVAPGMFTFASGREAAEVLLDVPDRPTAIFASNDDMATAVLAVARERGISVPEDLSIVGFDDADSAAIVSPALTTIRQPVVQMASDAFDLLYHREDSEERDIEFQHHAFELRIRDSVAKL